MSYSDPFGLCPICYVVFEVGATLFDLGDLAVTGVKYLRGNASGRELSVTAAGVVTGVAGFGGGYGRAARSLVRQGASDVRLWKQLASEELLSEARAGIGTAIAGAGARRGRAIQDIDRLLAQYGGEAGDWTKMTTRAHVADDGTKLSVHWYENIRTGQRVEFKTKIDNQ